MAKSFDAALNALIDTRPEDWAAFLAARLGIPPGPAEVIDTDLSVTAQADKLFRINGPSPALVHLELESSSRRGKPDRLMWYNTLARYQLPERERVPVYSVLMLLRPEAHADDQTGVHQVRGVQNEVLHEFRYTVLRVWQEPADTFLTAGPAFAPLALLTDEARADVPGMLGRFVGRLQRPGVPDTVGETVVRNGFVLCGLRYDQDQLRAMFMSIQSILDDSSTAQWMRERGLKTFREAMEFSWGELLTLRATLLRLGTKKFGPESTVDGRLNEITDFQRLRRMTDRIFDATSWDDLFATE